MRLAPSPRLLDERRLDLWRGRLRLVPSRQEARVSLLCPSSLSEAPQVSEVDGVKEKGADSPEFKRDRSSDPANDARFADAWSAPRKCRLMHSD